MENNSKKIFVDKQIFHKTKDKPFTWSDIKHIQFEDGDVIDCGYVEPYYSENNSWDGHYSCSIIRKVLETDEQFQKRCERNENQKKWAKEQRYKSYLKLKEEFDNPSTDSHE